MPGEHELAERFAVGRSTLREALRLLERDGLVDVFHGRGRFVSALATLHADRPVTEFESVTEMLEGLGYTVSNRVLRVEQAIASDEQALGLALQPGDPVVLLERLRLAGDEPLIYSVNAIDRRLIPARSPITTGRDPRSRCSPVSAHGSCPRAQPSAPRDSRRRPRS